MNAKGWEEILRTLDDDGIEKMAMYLEQVDEARQVLYRKGYGCIGMPINEIVEEIPE